MVFNNFCHSYLFLGTVSIFLPLKYSWGVSLTPMLAAYFQVSLALEWMRSSSKMDLDSFGSKSWKWLLT